VCCESLGSAPISHSFASGPLLIPLETQVGPKAPLPRSGLQQEHPSPYSQGREDAGKLACYWSYNQIYGHSR